MCVVGGRRTDIGRFMQHQRGPYLSGAVKCGNSHSLLVVRGRSYVVMSSCMMNEGEKYHDEALC